MKNSDLICNFCKKFHQIRVDNKLSKEKMAKALGITVYLVRKIESGILPPRLGCSILMNIYNAFGVLPSAMVSKSYK